MEVNCSLSTPHSNEYICSYFISPVALNSDKWKEEIAKHFPFEGSYRFRVKASSRYIGLNNDDFIWIDLACINADEIKGMLGNSKSLELQVSSVDFNALPLDTEVIFELPADEYDSYIREIANEKMFNPNNRPRSSQLPGSAPVAQDSNSSNKGSKSTAPVSKFSHSISNPASTSQDPFAQHTASPFGDEPANQTNKGTNSAASNSSGNVFNALNVGNAININAMKKGVTDFWKTTIKATSDLLQSGGADDDHHDDL
jgi:hypothetical protein